MPVPAMARRAWKDLSAPTGRPVAVFDADTLAPLPDPARRFLSRALPPGAPMAPAFEIRMHGEIRLNGRWLPFRAEQVLRSGVGFVWRPTIGGRLLRFTGADVLSPDGALMEFRFQGLIPVVTESGVDIERSAAGRLAAETVAWLPQALTPQAGTTWSAIDDRRAAASLRCASHPVDVEVTVGADGTLVELGLDRWNASARPPRFDVFGGRFDGEHTTPDGIRIARTGTVGWGWGTEAWDLGEFFRFTVDEARPIGVSNATRDTRDP